MKAILLQDIARGIGAAADGNAEIRGISIDSRTIQAGDLYVAIVGERFDGHDFIASAVQNGAAAVMSHKDVPCAVPMLRVEDTGRALLQMASWYRKLLDPFVVALTGSVGKTTTKEMIAAVFASEKKTLKTEGNLNNEIGMPRTLLRLEEDTQVAVIEMGMDNFGQISSMSRCACPDAALITKIGVSHMESLGSREGILAAKLEILEGLRPGGKLFLNADDPYLMSVKSAEHLIVYFGINNPYCHYRAQNIVSGDFQSEFDIVWQGGTQHIKLPAIGLHNVSDAVSAFAVGVEHGISPEKAAAGLAAYTPSGMRQRVHEQNGVTFIEDCYNASPESVCAALQTLSEVPAQRRIAVLGDMLELGVISEKAHAQTGQFAAKAGMDAVFTYGERSRLTAETAKAQGVRDVMSFSTHDALALHLAQYLQKGDAVLFKASRGMKLENVIGAVYAALSRKR